MKKRKIFLPVFLSLVLVFGGILTMDLVRGGREGRSVSPVGMGEAESEDQGYFRLLVAGVDDGGTLCDVMILLSIRRETGEIWGLQLPRDTYARYSAGSYRKLNGAANALGGMEELCGFLEESLALSIDGYLRLTPDALRRGVDALGGVEIDLDRDMDYEDPAQGLSIHLSRGKQVLDGDMAEQFVRYREGYLRGDLDRMDAQKQFLSALYGRVKETMTPMSAIRMAVSLLGCVQTDLTLPQLWELANLLLGESRRSVYLVTAPGEDARAKKSGASYFVLSAVGMDRLLAEHFGAEAGAFDRGHVFLNESYEEFLAIYEEDRDFHPFRLGQ